MIQTKYGSLKTVFQTSQLTLSSDHENNKDSQIFKTHT